MTRQFMISHTPGGNITHILYRLPEQKAENINF